ncbi:hypothetical protein PX699_30745 [Sphingobium sp. H39-3-25]|uniref:hypothetical protein n=1 Tax=Sphingobium arseniciresistens TaxID=3030834 RepID=UPI0023B89EDD|nr:hypothetical protein [Sphingobium arseniciresistens]
MILWFDALGRGICGQAPGNYRKFAEFLVGEGIDIVSLSPAGFVATLERVAVAEARRAAVTG